MIKGSEKGGNIVLLTQDQYEQEEMRLLLDKSTYRKLSSNPFPAIVMALNYKLNLSLEESLITKKEFNYLKVLQFNTPTFYIIPKLHKLLTDPPGRPIVSVISGPLEKKRKFVDALIKVHDLASYVQDTRDVLHQLDTMTLPEGALLVGIDVESLYTSIPHEWGLSAVQFFLDRKYPLMGSQNEFIIDILEFLLEHNRFQFLGTYYQQIKGTLMGAPWAPSYSCLHLGLWEEEIARRHCISAAASCG